MLIQYFLNRNNLNVKETTKYDLKNDKKFLKYLKKQNKFIHNSLFSEWPYFAAVFGNYF